MDRCAIVQNGKVLFSSPEMCGFGCIFYNLTGRNFHDEKGRPDRDGYYTWLGAMKRNWGVTDGPVTLMQDGKVVDEGTVGIL